MIKLRPYQERAVSAGIEYVRSKEKAPGIMVAPTGAGKSILIAEMVRAFGEKTIVLQPSRELCLQNYEKFTSYGYKASIYSASCGKKEISDITYATLGSVKKVVGELKEMGIRNMIIDECHAGYSPDPGSEFMNFVNELNPKKVIGFTATPCRLKQMGVAGDSYSQLNFITRMRPAFFKKVIHVTQIKEMVDLGFWTPLKYEVWEFDDSGLVLNSSKAEYTEESVSRAIAESGINNTILRRIMILRGKYKSILVFMDSVESCRTASKWYNAKYGAGSSEVVHGGMPTKKRAEVVEGFKKGDIQVVFNYSALGTGFDHPGLDCVIIGRPTFSFSNFYQYIGRAVRIKEGKKEALVVDCCNNSSRFGDVRNVWIEDYPGYGWGMFSGNRLITNIPMGDEVTKVDLDREKQKKDRKRGLSANIETTPITGRPDHPLGTRPMPFGKHKGWALHSVPASYFKFLVDKHILDNSSSVELKEYVSFLKERGKL